MGRLLYDWTNDQPIRSTPPALHLYPDLVSYLLFMLSVLETDRCVWRKTIRSISQTCRYWRRTALDNKQLWANMVDFESGLDTWNEELLKRSYPLPVDVISPSLIPRPKCTIQRELKHFSRIRSYRINFDDTAFPTLVESLNHPSPILQRLTLACRPSRQPRPLSFPSAFLGDHAPNLRRLELVRCSIDFQSPVVDNLTRLTVMDLDSTMAPTAQQWISHLSRMPGLAKLTIQNAIAPLRTASKTSGVHSLKAKLGSLRFLELDAHAPELAALFTSLVIPSSCDLNIVSTRTTEGADHDTVISVIRKALIYAYAIDPDSCPLSIVARGTSLSFTNEPPSVDFTRESPTLPASPIVYLCVETPPSSTWDAVFAPTLGLLGDIFPSVTSLELHLPSHLSDLVPYLTAAEKVKKLTNLTSVVTKKALQSLQVGDSTSQGGNAAPLPSLETILFTDDESMWGNAYAAFMGFLQWRMVIGKPVRRIEFRGCSVLKDRLESFKKLGMVVECDERGIDWRHL